MELSPLASAAILLAFNPVVLANSYDIPCSRDLGPLLLVGCSGHLCSYAYLPGRYGSKGDSDDVADARGQETGFAFYVRRCYLHLGCT